MAKYLQRLIEVLILFFSVSSLGLLLSGCAQQSLVPVYEMESPKKSTGFISQARSTKGASYSGQRYSQSIKQSHIPKYYTVKMGDTLYSIAWRFNKDYRHLARINQIPPPYIIYKAQSLSILGKVKSKRVKSNAANTEWRKTVTKKKAAFSKLPKQSFSKGRVVWSWPAAGAVIKQFSGAKKGNQGIDIKGGDGEPVKSAAPGLVVYSGVRLTGYGKLLIIKHNDEYLSAYAHNKKLLVKEGQVVKAGQKIAEIGSTGTDVTKLHFEIRREGKPVNPLSLLPRSRS